jgi:hypothetical protein
MYAWLLGTDSQNGLFANQTTTHAITAGEQFRLTLAAAPLYTYTSDWGPADATLHWYIYAGDTLGTAVDVLGQGYWDLGTGGDYNPPLWQVESATVTAGAIDAGHNIGIAILNSSGGYLGDTGSGTLADDTLSWVSIDDVSLEVVPEPGSIALLSLGGLALVAFRRSV